MTSATTLRQLLLRWLAIPLALLWSISTAVDYDVARRFGNLAYDRALLETALDIGRQVRVIDGRIYVDLPEVAVQMLETHETGRVWFLVTGPKGDYVTGEPDLPRHTDPGSDRVSYYDSTYLGHKVRVVALTLPLDTGSVKGRVRVRVAEPTTAREEFANQIILRMAIPLSVLILFAAIVLWIAVGKGLKPLAALRSEVEARSHRDLSPLSEANIPQEVQPLIRAINELLGRLSDTLAARGRFIADAAHQLRTPIAGIKTQTELALRHSPEGESRQALQQLRTATENTTRLVNQLLSLARAEPGAARVREPQRIDLATFAREATTDWVPQALARNIDLGYDGSFASQPVDGEPFLLRELINNLLDNAIRYTPKGGQVTVRVESAGDKVVLTVEDNGCGIPEADRERVFERFYRVLGTGEEGCGLGLAIVREIAESHLGSATVEPAASGGTVVRVTLPLAG